MFNKSGFLVTIDIEKSFYSVSKNSLITILEKFGLGNAFIYGINIPLKYQMSCIISKVKTSQYFKLEIETWQGVPISDIFSNL